MASRTTDVTADARFRIDLVGRFRLLAPGGEEIVLRSRRSQALLAFLSLTRGASATRERLAGLLWSDRGEAQARASLRQCLHEIREALPPAAAETLVAIGRDRIELRPSGFATEADAVLAAIEADDPAVLDRLGELTLLPDLAISELFDTWLAGERAAWDRRVLEGLRRRLDHAARSRSPAQVRRIADAYLGRDPAAEDVLAEALQADVEVAGPAEAQRRFRRFETELRRQLDAEPSGRLRSLLAGLVAPTPLPASTALPALAPVRPAADIDLPTILLVPFTTPNLGDASLLADLLTEDIEAALSRFRELRVISAPAGEEGQAAARLASAIAGFVLVGSVRARGGRVLLNVRLRTALGHVVWATREELSLADVESSADRVVRTVVSAVAPTVERELDQLLVGAEATTDQRVRAYCRARGLARAARDLAEAQAAAGALEDVLAGDPRNVGAHLHLARLYNTDFLHNLAGHDWGALRERAFALSRTAAELDPMSAHVHTMLSWCNLRRGAWEQARAHAEHALDLSPHYADRVDEAGLALGFFGDVPRAQQLVETAIALNPFPHREYLSDRAALHALAGNREEAERAFEAATDQSLHYLGLRVANLALHAGSAAAPLATRLRAGFAAIWQGDEPPGADDLAGWLEHHLPFHLPGHRMLLRDGLAQAGLAGG